MATKKGPGKPRREAMSRVDTAWLRMCRPTNPMMITGVLMFDEPMTLERLKQVIRKRFLAYPRFLQKAVDTAAGAAWVEDTNFDIDWHVRLSALPGRSDPQSEKRALERFVSQMASTPLDKTKPLWQFHLVERYRGGSALVARIHHSYADGIALVQVLLSLTDTTRKPDRGSELRAAWLKQDGVEVVRRVGAIDRYVKLGGKMLGKGMEMYRDPTLATMLAKEGGEIGRELLAALALSDDPPTLLRGPLGVSKRVAWAEPLDLEEVKAVGRACDCTVNDVLMATAAGALRSYLLERGENVDGVTLRATVPVNLRPLEHARKLGNHFGLVFLDLPVGEANPIRRVERVANCMNNLKNSRQAIVAFGLLAALGMAPAALQGVALELFSRKATAVATNVPGPQQPLYMGGSRVRDMMFWVPQTGSIGIGVSILSYNGRVHFGLIADAKLVPDPDAVIRRFGPEFEKLLYLALMGNWDYTLDAGAAESMLEQTAPAS
ncbi:MULTISPECIES: wax ester/triacylglycerol synthase family O-acyltransferase [Pseudoxanthomonas]|jgi:diacylglycerol O-acyltransferase|uniref:WS/DGAT/MGAT family O-acyltransferase n=1 Tax=Pseudoxanthomonas TaxID=83618 RepID=UPI001621CAD6|nr:MULTISPECIES: wax ester/triacylglycerol synthase family O-acyltransferase [Pseudoxanthomonas]MBB3276920.1 WS/DGAT/MGAT family acyltransferase [Pseudoxanthomonas sp. OG2]MBV7475788.1 wax ester/triacylglycerol synthase family O-acyltransferase [Pseudoxanthomonas sp. PXM05]UBB26726.1 wax ester/triacylglycerol synthase family O-acyltransferase [Pseudoxanthomonas japonensis]